MTKTVLNEKLLEQAKASDSASAVAVYNFAWQHLKAATVFRDHVCELELKYAQEPFGSFFEDIRSYASGTIMSATASLEALINELFISHQCELRSKFKDFETEFWGKNGVECKGTLAKYSCALQLLGLPILNVDHQTYRDVKALIELRNMLVHYKPNWDPNRKRDIDVVRALDARYKLSPFFNQSTSADFITMRSMSAGCATWAVQSVLRFLHEFDKHANLEANKMHSFWLLGDA